MTTKIPTSFRDLREPELKAAAEYFGTEAEGNKAVLLADLVESGVEWSQYHDVFIKPLLEAEAEEAAAAVAAQAPVSNVITSNDVNPIKEDTVTTVVEEVVTAPAVPVLAQANYLIKMERPNWLFEFGKYKFTKENPYAIMEAADAQKILSTETGFRQAFPDELQEFYS